MNLEKSVLACGTFDLFHQGHQFFLRQAATLAKNLIVIIARDENVFKQKGFYPLLNEQERKKKVKQFNLTSKVFLGDKKDKLKLIKKINPNILAIGFDQKIPLLEIKKKFPNLKIVKITSHFPEKFKSSILRKK